MPAEADIARPRDPAVDEALRLVGGGRDEEARQLISERLKARPDDAQLRDLSKRLERHDVKLDAGSLAQKIRALFSDRDAGQAPAGGAAIMAAPLGFLAGNAATPRPAILPPALRATVSKATFLKMGMKDYAGAESDLTATLEKYPDNWMAYRLRALTRRFLNKLPEAEQDADRALALNPRDGPSYGVKALLRLDTGDALGARDEAMKAIALNPRDPDAHFTLSQALEGLGQGDAALEELRTAAELDAQFGQAYRRALFERGEPSRLSRARALYLGAAGLALLFLGMSLFMRRSATTAIKTPLPMRVQDREGPPIVGGYTIRRRLAQGGMGVVYEAVDEALQRTVALKQMRSEIAGDPRERRRFLKEARMVASLRHAHIVEIFSVVEQSQELFLVFEYLPGQTLNELLDKGGRFAPGQALALARQIASALDFAHAQGVVHQDLKPSNVVVSDGRVKVMDFGIARRVQDTLSTMSRSEAAGTPAYMAPEQELGRFQKETDIYAFGVCLYELLSGHSPFNGGASAFVKAERRYTPLSQAAGLPAAVDQVIARALDPDPSGRPASAAALLGELEHALALPA